MFIFQRCYSVMDSRWCFFARRLPSPYLCLSFSLSPSLCLVARVHQRHPGANSVCRVWDKLAVCVACAVHYFRNEKTYGTRRETKTEREERSENFSSPAWSRRWKRRQWPKTDREGWRVFLLLTNLHYKLEHAHRACAPAYLCLCRNDADYSYTTYHM